MHRDENPGRASAGRPENRYLSLLHAAQSALVSAATVLGLSFAIVWPLWFLATKSRQAYTAVIASAAGLALCFCLVRALRRAAHRGGRKGKGGSRASGGRGAGEHPPS